MAVSREVDSRRQLLDEKKVVREYMSLVSVIMPSLNVAPYIKQCIESVQNQTLQDIEILCVDAGSTDGTLEILQECAISDSRIKILHSDMRSYGHQVNMGIRYAHAKYVAIVETDDYIESEMYQSLYEIAEKYELDVVKADYDFFYSETDGTKHFETVKMYGDCSQYYQIVNGKTNPELHYCDISVWKGLFRKAFLMEKGIAFNESAGAAYQDIGFHHQAVWYSERMMYVPDSYYRYRRDNELSSSNSLKAVRFFYQEYKRLIEKCGFLEKDLQQYRAIVWRIAVCFLIEYQKCVYGGAQITEEWTDALEWIRNFLGQEMEKGNLKPEEAGEKFAGRIRTIISDRFLFEQDMEVLAQKYNAAKSDLKLKINGNPVIIFGCGSYGKIMMHFMWENRIHMECFVDNNVVMQNTKCNEYDIVSPLQLNPIQRNKIVIANKYHVTEIADQLQKLGIDKRDIIIPDEILFTDHL